MIKLLNKFLNFLKQNIFSQKKYLETEQIKVDFEKKTFKHNNTIVIILGYFLFFEQLYYSFFVRESGSLHQQIHLVTAIVMLIFAVIATYINLKKIQKVNMFHRILVIGFVLAGLLIAVGRTSLLQDQIYSLSTIYLAVIYGLAAAFYFSPVSSFALYTSTSIILILLLSGQSVAKEFSYVQDTISNNIIAWIVSTFNFKRYLNSFIKSKKITDMNEKLRYLSARDPLTDLFNRRKLDDFLIDEINRTERTDNLFSVIILDIDDFKKINDNFGHNIGDKILIDFSKILTSNIRDLDKLGRWGGEEFLIIAPSTDKEGAENLARKIKKIISDNDFRKLDKLNASFGVATYNQGESIYQLINRADKALYQAKSNGKNKVVVNDISANDKKNPI